jgi:Ca-activated chloride channel family protein
MVVYAGASGEVLEPTSGRHKARIMHAIRELGAGGSTAGAEGLEHAYALARRNFDEDAVNRVILMTDGDFNVGVTDEGSLEDMVAEQRKSGVYLSVYGFGQDNYQDRRMQAISQAGNGTAATSTPWTKARKLFREDLSSSVFPIADDVKIQVEFNPAKVAEWRLIGYETRQLAREDFNNDRIDAARSARAHGHRALRDHASGRARLRRSAALRREPGARRSGAASRRDRPGPLPLQTPGRRADRCRSGSSRRRDAPPTWTRARVTRWAVAVAGYGSGCGTIPIWAPLRLGPGRAPGRERRARTRSACGPSSSASCARARDSEPEAREEAA